MVFRRASQLSRGIHSARAIAAHAVMEAEDKAPGWLTDRPAACEVSKAHPIGDA